MLEKRSITEAGITAASPTRTTGASTISWGLSSRKKIPPASSRLTQLPRERVISRHRPIRPQHSSHSTLCPQLFAVSSRDPPRGKIKTRYSPRTLGFSRVAYTRVETENISLSTQEASPLTPNTYWATPSRETAVAASTSRAVKVCSFLRLSAPFSTTRENSTKQKVRSPGSRLSWGFTDSTAAAR